jgi:hypothetical protein
MLTAEQKAWSKKLEKLLAAMPEGIEIIVGMGQIAVMEAGFFKREIYASDVDMLSGGGTLISKNALLEFKVDRQRVRPDSESI